MISPAVLEPVAMRAFPATVEERLGDWTLRSDTGLPNRRVNSAWDLGDPEDGVRSAVTAVERWYEARGRRAIIKTTPGSATDAAVSEWPIEAPTSVLTRETGPSEVSASVVLSEDSLESWCAAFVELRGFEPGRREALVASYGRLDRIGLALIEDASGPVAVGLGVLDGPWIGLFDIATSVERQRQGLARAVTAALVGWGHANGAETTYLQVEQDNAAALALYRRLGFTHQYAYHYRVGP